ncbi:hypothetical protein FE782_09580 [Paenibacillus antri]|uniref:Uncharacterized protein n=1 Tax=Paenibacillus antri TaxID=2582848 RepID=A0A5R9GFR3_9BACL|nr:hypothetical protein [Paenibacillus antri]TLS52218.1 hypothetical protein FE782_09580 [Paenibacillus antri]
MPIVDRYDPNTESGLGYKLFIPKVLAERGFPFHLISSWDKKKGERLELIERIWTSGVRGANGRLSFSRHGASVPFGYASVSGVYEISRA